METTFITIHDLSLDARIRYASDSVEEVLGYLPHDVVGKSCWEYFHPDEIPFARAIHGRGVKLDKAAVLNYCQIKHRDGYWVGCECAFSIVYNVMVACTTIYRRNYKSDKRAFEAPVIRRLFSSSPRDPRYHMLSYISSKFSQPPQNHIHEPRAALFLNRFTRTLTIMFATNGLDRILNVPSDQLPGKSFYYCIEEACLQDAIGCLEAAKANDSIAYLRFWFRNPLQEEAGPQDAVMGDRESSDEDDDGGVHLSISPLTRSNVEDQIMQDAPSQPTRSHNTGRVPLSLQGDSGDTESTANDSLFDTPAQVPPSSSSSMNLTSNGSNTHWDPVEVEAVVSCTSDGLVVILRRARPIIPQALQHPTPTPLPAAQPAVYDPGFFAAPWALEPIHPPPFAAQPQYDWNVNYGLSTPSHQPTTAPATNENFDVMNTIREVAVFAWGLTGINGSLAQFSRGSPSGESQPPGGMPVWDPTSHADPENIYNGFTDSSNRRLPPPSYQASSDPTSTTTGPRSSELSNSGSGSDNENVWRRVPVMPAWQPTERRVGSQDSGMATDYGSGGRNDSGGVPINGGRNENEEDERALRRMGLM